MAKKAVIAAAALAVATSGAQAQGEPERLDAAASDPAKMGWMQGSPPAADKMIRLEDLGHFTFPKTRWSFSNYRQFTRSIGVTRGDMAVVALPRAERKDIDAIHFTPLGGTQPMTWAQSLSANYTDGIVVLHRGSIIYERYFGVTTPHSQHIAFSVTKSFIGTLAASLAAEGRLDPDAPVTRYVPELAQSGFGDATVRQVMDMTTGIAFDETYTNPNADIFRHALAGGFGPRPKDYAGPEGLQAFLLTIGKKGEHGERFTYRTANTDALAWIVERVSGERIATLLEDRFWRKLGMEQDASMQIDGTGMVFGGGGLMPALRDMARFGEMMRNGGKWQGKQVVPAAAIADITKGGGKTEFAKNGAYPTLPGWSYRNQWWVSHNDHGAYSARGIHGQAIYIDPKAEMVIARFASHPMAGNVAIDPTSIPAYEALGRLLVGEKGR
ncbi:MAG: serine hydrolase [Sphingomonadales bacterium]|jgi:CubicO group peptidase (beta-lactamase class C family)|nr:serine hydrolase [Sphingomonadales bacterium]MBK9003155.1 serine hydrolase [Sphingomonadales bacterium]MBK9268402.1 serine hydrolase [Sphingomonadales bacterium]